MDLRKYISANYPTVKPFEGINSVEKSLLKYKYLVISDDDCNFYGILTTSDVIERPHKIVIDCVTKKESLMVSDSLTSALNKFYTNNSLVLPVMDGSDFIGVIEKNRVLKGLETQVNQLYDKSLISEKVKNNFLNNLSHETRTPLNGILGFLDIIEQFNTKDFTKKHETYSKLIKKSADHFLIIMNDLVNLSLLHSGDKLIINKDRVDIVKIFIELKDYFNELLFLQNKKATLIYSNSESSLSIFTDGKKVKHILYHLINNAIKFSEENKVTFGFELNSNDKNISLFVKNKDSKISQKDVLKMFDVFEKQENIGKEFNFGLGIGLPLVKKLTNLIGGQIEVETKNEEILFIVNIPIEKQKQSSR